jgi:8-oxo-dGTP diphosphatase
MAANTFEADGGAPRPPAGGRLYPVRPILAVSLGVVRDGRVLLMARARAPLSGLFTLPGGLVELGESLEQACLRELDEETGVSAEILGFNDHACVIERDAAGAVRRHYVIASFVGRWLSGEGRPSAEAAELIWAAPDDWARLSLTPNLDRFLVRALEMAKGAPK